MYRLKTPIIMPYDEEIPAIRKCFKEILGYTDEEVDQFISFNFLCTVVKHLTVEQIALIVKPFYDNGVSIYIVNEETDEYLSYNEVGIYLTKEPPKDHYYDQPIISREHLVNPLEQKRKELYEIEEKKRILKATANRVKCPYCQSTNCKKISALSKAGSVALWGIFALGKTTKQWHCRSCGSDF